MTYQNQSPKPAREQSTDMLLDPMLNALAKALKALTFYPVGHPQRSESVAASYKQITPSSKITNLSSSGAGTGALSPKIPT